MNPWLPPGNEVWNKVMFLQLFVSQQGGEGRCYDVTSCYRQHPLPPDSNPPSPQHPQAIPPPRTVPPPVNKRAVRILLECFLFGKFNDSNEFCKRIVWEIRHLSFSNAMRQCHIICSQAVLQRGQGYKIRSCHRTSMNYQVKFFRSAIISFN